MRRNIDFDLPPNDPQNILADFFAPILDSDNETWDKDMGSVLGWAIQIWNTVSRSISEGNYKYWEEFLEHFKDEPESIQWCEAWRKRKEYLFRRYNYWIEDLNMRVNENLIDYEVDFVLREIPYQLEDNVVRIY